MRLFHISEDPAITRFVPRAPLVQAGMPAVVWAVAEPRLWSYLLPRDCPRVLFHAGAGTTSADCERYLLGDRAARVLAIETAWYQRCLTTPIYRYEFMPESFVLQDAPAHYYVATTEQIPIACVPIANPLAALIEDGVELRIMPTLWVLSDQICQSSLEWSCIRMRNATPRSSLAL
ncbi:MAG: hypothetical protein Fur005_47300 [Roseiflexaceae bacterium]